MEDAAASDFCRIDGGGGGSGSEGKECLRNGKLKGLVDKLDSARAGELLGKGDSLLKKGGNWLGKKGAGVVDNYGATVLSDKATAGDALEAGGKIAAGLAGGDVGRTKVGGAVTAGLTEGAIGAAKDQYERPATDRGFRHEEYRFEEAD